ncbi:hypothetical protein J5N97_014189 [Dioscorea zingiberensis]|uniref:Uncharacterized protein n=1 Tax=Dioscorea zingiberensis TaxID=325984 RepID=A0A9D5CUR8_9LILI|nr:hypothetical protein J5N97_014189 [Dioscorea zingiberensis]
MATDGHIEEKTVVDDIKSVDVESVSQPCEIEQKDKEETKKVEDSANSEAFVTEAEEKLDCKVDAAVEELKTGEEVENKAAELDEKMEDKADAVIEEVKKEDDDNKINEPEEKLDDKIDVAAEELKEENIKSSDADVPAGDGSDKVENSPPESDISNIASESAVEVTEKGLENKPDELNVPEPPTEAPEKHAEEPIVAVVQEPEAETAKEPAVSEPVTEEVVELSQDEKPLVQQVASLIPDTVATVVSNATEALDTPKAESEPIADKGVEEEPIKGETEVGEAAVESVKEVEHKDEAVVQEQTVKVEESSRSVPTKTDDTAAEVATEEKKTSGGFESAEKKTEESVETEKITPVETSRDFVVETDSGAKAGESEDKKEETEKADDKKAETPAKDEDDTKANVEAPKEGPPAKPPQRHSNTIISKVKQSIVKVKKAIIGKSSSSKTISVENKDEITVK